MNFVFWSKIVGQQTFEKARI